MTFLAYMNSPKGRAIRVAVGTGMVVAGAARGGGWWALAAAGLLPLGTGALGICPVTLLMRTRNDGSAGADV